LILKASELQAGFASRFGQGLDTAVVGKTGAVESDLLDTGGLGLLGNALADQSGRFGVDTLVPQPEMTLA
jgi:hypothetical protein